MEFVWAPVYVMPRVLMVGMSQGSSVNGDTPTEAAAASSSSAPRSRATSPWGEPEAADEVPQGAAKRSGRRGRRGRKGRGAALPAVEAEAAGGLSSSFSAEAAAAGSPPEVAGGAPRWPAASGAAPARTAEGGQGPSVGAAAAVVQLQEDARPEAAGGDPGVALQVPSRGSSGHPDGCGLPCKYARKAKGCKDGEACARCHLCRWTGPVPQSTTAAPLVQPPSVT